MTALFPAPLRRTPDTAWPAPSVDVDDVLSRGQLVYLAVRTKGGPLVTPVLYGVGGGRLWFVTRRQVLKARLLARRPDTAWVVRDGERAVAMRGRASLLTAATPVAWIRHTTRPPFGLPFGLGSWAVRNPREVAGFVVDGVTRPSTIAPHNFVLVSLEPTATEPALLPLGSPTDGPGLPLPEGVPAGLDALLRRTGWVTVGLDTAAGVVAVPGVWDPRRAVVRVPARLLDGVGSTLPACVTFDEPVRGRPTQQRGVVLRGDAELTSAGEQVEVRMVPRRVTFWDGFEKGTVAYLPGDIDAAAPMFGPPTP